MSKIGITMGDPAGIGYEITAKAVLSGEVPVDRLVLIGNREAFFKTAELLKLDLAGLSGVEFADVAVDGFDFGTMEFGRPQEMAGKVALKSVETGMRLALEGRIDGICTAPLHRDALELAGSQYRDHTGMLTSLTSSSDVTTLYELQKLRTMLLSRHLSLEEALKSVKKENIKKHIRLCDQALKLLGTESRRIAVAALNPHGGEGGLTGNTEELEIEPAIEESKGKFDVCGPVPADVVYHRALGGDYDIVLSLYHDQAHIALKTVDFYRTVDMNIGLPFLRVSVDHGPGYDRAGQGRGIETNMVVAIKKTLQYAPVYRKQKASASG